ncbi:MarC family protein [Flavihumibacter petaseus]|uniref:UPF0056 membrane protein n=1 Tax=Flavihumibacter petaseus NBRC 106054 TaxID=1220578 RepID=A0A0E9N5S2_9BACT|nr:MarC family protein [Flavihumibacter petaseus]GAO45153.1 hypothetical protein FPE01S_04_03960 [Flavihumibacter petaseus NBRC 106054]
MPENLIPQLEFFFSIIPLTYVALFHVINPIGSGVLFYNITPGISGKERRVLAKKIAFNTAIMLVVILACGIYIMKLFGITVPIIKICGGMVILAMGWRSLQQDDDTNESDKKLPLANTIRGLEAYRSKIFYPFTFPFTVGPGTISVALTISAESLVHRGSTHSVLQYAGAGTAVLLVALTIYVCYGSTDMVLGRMSLHVRQVVMKIFSFILLCIGGQIVFGGVEEFVRQVVNGLKDTTQ